jgi:hypothetical protein
MDGSKKASCCNSKEAENGKSSSLSKPSSYTQADFNEDDDLNQWAGKLF